MSCVLIDNTGTCVILSNIITKVYKPFQKEKVSKIYLIVIEVFFIYTCSIGTLLTGAQRSQLFNRIHVVPGIEPRISEKLVKCFTISDH